MSAELLFEITRYNVGTDTENLIERAQVISRDGALWRRVDDGPETLCQGSDVAAAIGADAALSEVRANQVTRVKAEPAALSELPLVMSVTGDGTDFDESLWSKPMVVQHLDDSAGADVRGVYRVLYVNDERWGAFTTTKGQRLLPDDWGDDSGRMPLLTPCWGELTFCEWGGVMVGGDLTIIGPVTFGVVVCATMNDDWADHEILLQRRGDDAGMFVEWLLQGTLIDAYATCNPFIDLMMAQLFVEASMNDFDGKDISGSYLVTGNGIVDPDELMCTHDTSTWRLQLELEPAVINAVLDLFAQGSHRLSDIVTAARDPGSPAGLARRAAAKEWEQHDPD